MASQTESLNTLSEDKLNLNNDYLVKMIKNSLNMIGGLSKYISANDSVLIKPNFNTADPYPASTDPSFLLSVIEILKNRTSNIQIIETSTFSLKTNKVINKIFGEKLMEVDVPIVTESSIEYKKVNLSSKGAKYIKNVKFPDQILNLESKVILLPCLKTHFIAEYTGALKLAVGFMERKQKARLHMSIKVPEKVAEINLAYKPDLIIMDARKIFVTGGPQRGTIEYPDEILVSTSRRDIDIQGVNIIKRFHEYKNKIQKYNKAEEVRTIKRAIELKIL